MTCIVRKREEEEWCQVKRRRQLWCKRSAGIKGGDNICRCLRGEDDDRHGHSVGPPPPACPRDPPVAPGERVFLLGQQDQDDPEESLRTSGAPGQQSQAWGPCSVSSTAAGSWAQALEHPGEREIESIGRTRTSRKYNRGTEKNTD